MKKLLGGLVILGAVAGGAAAIANYLKGRGPAEDVAQLTFDDGSTRSLAPDTPEGAELADIARKLVEIKL